MRYVVYVVLLVVTQIQIGRSGVLPGTSGGFIVCEPVR